MTFDSFYQDAAYLFGVTENEAADLWDELEAAGFDPAHPDALTWEIASDLLEDVFATVELPEDEEPYEEESRYSLDSRFPDDDWIDAFEEWEITPTYEER